MPAALSPGLTIWQTRSDRHPQPMHAVESVAEALEQARSARRGAAATTPTAVPVLLGGGAPVGQRRQRLADLVEA